MCDVRFLFSENAANLKIWPTTRPNLENKRNYRNEVGTEHYIVMTCLLFQNSCINRARFNELGMHTTHHRGQRDLEIALKFKLINFKLTNFKLINFKLTFLLLPLRKGGGTADPTPHQNTHTLVHEICASLISCALSLCITLIVRFLGEEKCE